MKKIMMMMSILMGFSMSLVLSLLGVAGSGHFSVPSWMVSFGISFLISLLIGFAVPVKKVCDAACNKCGIIPESFKGNLMSSVVSDLIYTPVITIAMVVMMVGGAAKKAIAAGAPADRIPSVAHALVPSLIMSLVVGYFVILILQPLFLKLLLKNAPKGKPGENPEGRQ